MPTTPTTGDVLDSVLSSRPDVLNHLSSAHRAAAAVVDPRILDLCTIRVASLLGGAVVPTEAVDAETMAALPSWPTDPRFNDVERACLALTEHFVVDVATLPDELAEPVVEALGAEGFANFITALLVNEQRIRLCLIWDRLFDGDLP